MNTVLFSLLFLPSIAGSVLCAVSRKRRLLETVAALSAGVTFAAALWLIGTTAEQHSVTGLGEWLFADALSAYIAAIVSGSTLVVALYSVGYLRRQVSRGKVGEQQFWLYYLLLNVFLFTMMVVLLSNNLGFLWIGAEATTLATAFFVAFYEQETSVEAAWKYVIICSVGIAIALFGIILTYFSALHVVPAAGNALNWSTLMLAAKDLDPAVLKLAFIFVLVGFGTKAGVAPMHTWKPDAYGAAPAPISALMAAGLVNVALYALMRFYILTNKVVGDSFAPMLFQIFGLVSMGVAVPFILLQRDFKRLLAYSSVEHVGIILFALGLGTPLAFLGALLHLLNNALAKTLLFLTAGNVRQAYNSRFMRKVTGAIKVIPASATFLIIGVFAITGWPPFGLFVSELTIVTAGFASGNVVPSVLFVAFIAIAFIGFIYYGSKMVLGEPQTPVTGSEAGTPALVLLGLLAVALVILGVTLPHGVLQSIENAVHILRG